MSNPTDGDLGASRSQMIDENENRSVSAHSSSRMMIENKNHAALGSQTRVRYFNPGQGPSGTNPGTRVGSPTHSQILPLANESTDYAASQTIWGTSIDRREVEAKFRNFLKNFTASVNDQGEEVFMGEKVYLTKLNVIRETENYVLEVDADHIFQYDRTLYNQTVYYPSDIIGLFDKAAGEVYAELFAGDDMSMVNIMARAIHVNLFHLRKVSRMRDLNPEDIGHLIAVKGIVIRCSDIIPEIRTAHFRCTKCGRSELINNVGGRIEEPQDCAGCKAKFSFEIIHNLCRFLDRQLVKFQETPDSVPDGETPQTINLLTYEELVDSVRPGDKVEVTGIFRAQAGRLSQNKRVVKSVFNTYVDVLSFTKSQKQKLFNTEGSQEEYFTEETKKQVLELSNHPNIYDKLVASFSPSIWENEDVKKGILCQLFGGTPKEFSQAGRGRFRAEVNVLLVGDPSTAKSQLLQYVHKIAPRGIYTSGKGSSAVGLTAYVSKDPETREIILESGALVLSDKGICCIDEFDKMDDNTKVMLHEAMEQQTISIAKAGIVCQLNARTAVLASANPVESRYNPKRSVVENIRLPPTLISRFDLIYLMLDRQNEAQDKKLASHILSMYSKDHHMDIEESSTDLIDRELLSKYISYARTFCKPKLSASTVDELVHAYVDMRRLGTSKNVITATPRQLESMIRLSEALAKMRLSSEVEKKDVEEAVRLIKVATQQAATDPVTGHIDMDLISTGITAGSRNKIGQLVEHIRNICKSNEEQAKRGIKYVSLYEELKKKFDIIGVGLTEPFTEIEYKEALKILEEDGVISLFGNKKAPIIRLVSLTADK